MIYLLNRLRVNVLKEHQNKVNWYKNDCVKSKYFNA